MREKGAGKFLAYLPIATLAVVLVMGLALPSPAQTFSVIHNFDSGAGGANPYAGVTIDRAGNLYGTTRNGGAGVCSTCGVVYKLAHSGAGWIQTPLYEFQGIAQGDGQQPVARVIFGPDGALYGTTNAGGPSASDGTAFRLTPSPTTCRSTACPWNETVLHAFTNLPDGAFPGMGDVIFDAAGNLYGTTVEGGSDLQDCDDRSCGTVYKLTHSGGSWSESVYPLAIGSAPGFWPQAGVIFDSAGNLYGTVTNTSGGVFVGIPANGQFNFGTVYNFLFMPQYDPAGGLIFDAAGNLYGTTAGGGTSNGGTVFELVRSGGSWNFTVLYNLVGSGSVYNPGPEAALTMDAAGNLYGTTYADGVNNCGSVFKLTPSNGSWTYTSLHDFSCGDDGEFPISNVSFDAAGNLYGTTESGGANGTGVVWEIVP